MSLEHTESTSKLGASTGLKEVDCAILFMLDEERDFFLEYNHKFFIASGKSDIFLEFFFIDKNAKLRTGVLCSDGANMGNYAASVLFYKLSRKYKAHLYINVGVAGRIDEVNVGDVLFVDRLSSTGENNANNKTYQLQDAISYTRLEHRRVEVRRTINSFVDGGFSFSETSNKLNHQFIEAVTKEMGIPFSEDSLVSLPLGVCQKNKCRRGWCITFPEVIKDKDNPDYKAFLDPLRPKSALIDMEAYYLSEWHALIKREEPDNSVSNSEFIAIKSVSDCGDNNKLKYEKSGSRHLAMNNLTEAVTCLCCEFYSFPRTTSKDGTLLQMLDEIVSQNSIIKTVRNMISKHDKDAKQRMEFIDKFEKLFIHFARRDAEDDSSVSVDFHWLEDFFTKRKSLVSIYGPSGTGKTTFLSFFYYYLKAKGFPVIYWEIPFFCTQKSPTPRQIIYALSRLLKTDKRAILILDGVKTLENDNETRDDFIEMIQNSSIHNLCVSYGDVVDSSNMLMQVIEASMSIPVTLQFGKVCIDSDEFALLLDAAVDFFHGSHENDFSAEDVKRLLINSHSQPKLVSIDYMLLYMLSEKADLIKNKTFRYLYTFLNTYLVAKYGGRRIKAYIDEIYSSLVSSERELSDPYLQAFEASQMIRYNTYAQDIAYATAIFDLFRQEESEKKEQEIQVFFKKKLLLPSDVTMILEDKLLETQRQQGESRILESMIDALQDNFEKSAEMESQILYTASSLCERENAISSILKERILQMCTQICTDMKEADKSQRMLLLLQYRSLCIILSRFFGTDDNLARFNSMLLKCDRLKTVNIAFHFYFYSGKLFSFQDVISFNSSNVYDEMFYNTYYVLKNYMDQPNFTNQFFMYNLITFMHLYSEAIVPSGKYGEMGDTIKKICKSYQKKYKELRLVGVDFFDDFKDLLDRTVS